MDEVSRDTKSVVDKILKDVGKASAAKQLLIGTVSGWCTGFVTMKVGKAAAVALGGGIILLQIANHKGYLKINWDKVHKEVDKIADKVEEKATGEGPRLMDKMERMIDRNIDKAEDLLRKKQRKAKSWYHNLMGDEDYFQVQEIHIFIASFVLGFSVGIITGH